MTTWFWSEDVRVLKRMIAVAALALPMLAGAEEIGQVSTVFKFLGPNDRIVVEAFDDPKVCLLYTSPSPRDLSTSRMPSSA